MDYGGGFTSGNSSDRMYDGEHFARQSVIFVTFNYRLGRFGHFAFPALAAEHSGEPKGSYAFMDQIAALKWVHDNISTFGGDPDNVTIFGESAGGVSVHALLTIPAADGLFHKAIIESGGGRDGVLSPRPIKEENASPYYPISAEQIGVNFARHHGITGTDAESLAELRALSAEDIVDGGIEAAGDTLLYSGPILDGILVKESAESAYHIGHHARIPIIIGSNSAEVPGGFIHASDKNELFNLFGNYRQEAISVYDTDQSKDFAQLMMQITTDKVWAEPARFTASTFTQTGQDAYVYLFSYVPADLRNRVPGARHASEIPYVFGNLDSRWGVDKSNTEDKEVSRLMNGYWVNFAKTGDPNGEDLPQWDRHSVQSDMIMEFGVNGKAVCIPNPKRKRLDVIEKVFGRK